MTRLRTGGAPAPPPPPARSSAAMPADAIEVIEPGLMTTVQDLGRHGYQRYGIPASGALDSTALAIGNVLLGNPPGMAGLEVTLAGPTLLFQVDTIIAVTGANLTPRIDGAFMPMWQAVPVARGMTLSFRERKDGARAYLLVAGGIDVQPVMSSRSTYVRSRFGGFEGRALQAGDRLPVPEHPSIVRCRRFPFAPPRYAHVATLRVIAGPHDRAFEAESIRTFFSSVYSVSQHSDRMGYRLEGPPLRHSAGADIISEGTPPGAVQVTGDGLPIILLADRGTAGGYTKIATVISADLSRAAQLAPGDRVRFVEVNESEALSSLARHRERERAVALAPTRVFRRMLLSAPVESQHLAAVTGFEEVFDQRRLERGEAESCRQVWINGHSYRVTSRFHDVLPPRRPACRATPPDAVLEAAAAVAATSAARLAEAGSDMSLCIERAPLGPELEELPVMVSTPAGDLTVSVRMPVAEPTLVFAADRSLEAWFERREPR